MNFKKIQIGIIGLGYVGLPLAVAFSKKYDTVGYDINNKRIEDLILNIDTTNEIEDFEQLKKILLTNNIEHLKSCNVYIITVPTPVDHFNKPDLKPLYNATENIAKLLSKNDIVIYESTVYPGCTEEECVPIFEKISNLINLYD